MRRARRASYHAAPDQEVGTGNLGINLDPANLILYGSNPVDALDVFGAYVRSVHAKDGFYPTTPYQLGEEVKIGSGKVNFPLFLSRLAELNYQGPLIIEREISGSQQILDIRELTRIFRTCWLAKKKLAASLGFHIIQTLRFDK